MLRVIHDFIQHLDLQPRHRLTDLPLLCNLCRRCHRLLPCRPSCGACGPRTSESDPPSSTGKSIFPSRAKRELQRSRSFLDQFDVFEEDTSEAADVEEVDARLSDEVEEALVLFLVPAPKLIRLNLFLISVSLC